MIEVSGISKTFRGRTVLRDVSFSVGPGEVFGYLGPNGAGKTTTMRIMLGLLRPSGGTALVNGVPLADDLGMRRRVGVLLENDGLFDRLRARETIDWYARLYGVRDRERRIDELLAFGGLTERAGDRVGTFSKGMKRTLGLVRALVHDPSVILLDEPTSGLDPEAQKRVRDLVTRLSAQEGRIVFLNSHNLDEVQRICTRVAILSGGTIRASGSVDELRGNAAGDSWEVVAADEDNAVKACLALDRSISRTVCSREGRTVTVRMDGEPHANLIAHLVGQGVVLDEVRRMTRSLEDVYLDAVRAAGGEGGTG